jgi:hypothetical protein
MFSIAALATAAGVLLDRSGRSEPEEQAGSLQDHGAPRGRVGAATRGDRAEASQVSLDLVAPLQGIGLTGTDQPVLYYVLSGGIAGPMRMAISAPGRSRPLADFELPRAQPASLGLVHLSERRVRLSPNLKYVWSVALLLDPNNPSRDLVCSAPIQFRPAGPDLEQAVREAPPERRHAVFARAGYWYDAVTSACAISDRDQGTAIAELLAGQGLRWNGRHQIGGSRPRAVQ